jgi:predicted ester cyclase
MRTLLAVLFPVVTFGLSGCAAMPPSTPARGADVVERNKALVRELTEVVWNRRGLDRIPDFYAPDFVAGYRPYSPLREGHEGIRRMVEGAWTAFPDYHEELHELIAEGDRVVVHLTISGPQNGQWGPLPPTGRRVRFEEILILQSRDGKVRRQRGTRRCADATVVTGHPPAICSPNYKLERPGSTPAAQPERLDGNREPKDG